MTIESQPIVLVVEDETIVRLNANDALSDAGYRVLEARDGQEALTVLELHQDIGVLFTDVNMPFVDGLSLAKLVAERWPKIGILLTSAVPLPSEPPEQARFISKPYKLDEIENEIKALFDNHPHRPL